MFGTTEIVNELRSMRDELAAQLDHVSGQLESIARLLRMLVELERGELAPEDVDTTEAIAA